MPSLLFNVRSKKKVKAHKRKYYHFSPTFTEHSLLRISERFSHISYSYDSVEILWDSYRYKVYTKWVSPLTIKHMMSDMHRNKFNIFVSDMREWFLLKWKNIWYVLWNNQEVITVYPHEWFSYISKYNYKPLAHKSILNLFT